MSCHPPSLVTARLEIKKVIKLTKDIGILVSGKHAPDKTRQKEEMHKRSVFAYVSNDFT